MLEAGRKVSATIGFWIYFESRANIISKLEVMSLKEVGVKNNPRLRAKQLDGLRLSLL